MAPRFARFGVRALVAAGLAAAFVLGRGVTAQAPVPKAEDPPYRGLDANLYMQSSAEYRACCLQAYNLAALRLKEALAANPAGTPAVALDLDETVFDNGSFQAEMIRNNFAYDQRAFDRWEEVGGDHVTLVPGAKEFLTDAAKAGVVPVYISNRNDRYRDRTLKTIARLGLPVPTPDRLKLATTTSDKTARRAEAEKAYTVLLHIGDNLRDFDDKFKFGGGEVDDAAIQARKAAVDADAAKFGSKWVILPNPAYGEWNKALGRGKADLDRLVRWKK